MRLDLKGYQTRAIKRLRDYLTRVRDHAAKGEQDPAAKAFAEVLPQGEQEEYAHVPGLDRKVPNVCLKIPTGGGKTILGIECLAVVAQALQGREGCVVLWMAPTDRIVAQTLNAMRDARHPYHAALAEGATVVGLDDAFTLGGPQLARTCVIVTTSQALRVEDRGTRKIYEDVGYDQHAVSPPAWDCNQGDSEFLARSLANVIRSRRPLVVIDEAHKGRNELLAKTLRRFEPCCILELTATPERNEDNQKDVFPSNLLYRVSADELKKDGMIKLPIHLRGNPGLDVRELLRQAVACRNELQEKAKAEKRYIRPVMLLQAQSKSQTHETVHAAVLKSWLVDEMGIPREQVAICTGEIDELGDQPVSSDTCPLRYIITVDKLREGWDCPFAYVLFSINNVATATAVEQVLGRVLRLPYAEKPMQTELAEAYAFVSQPNVSEVADRLAMELSKTCGFDKREARKNIWTDTGGLPFPPGDSPLWNAAQAEPTVSLPDRVEPERVQDLSEMVAVAGRGAKLKWIAPKAMREEDRVLLTKRLGTPGNAQAVKELFWKTQHLGGRSRLRVPYLAVRVEGQLELFEDQFAPLHWRIVGANADLSEGEFPRSAGTQLEERIDVRDGGRVVLETTRVNIFAPEQTLFDIGPKDQEGLVRFLADNTSSTFLFSDDLTAYLIRVIRSLLGRGYRIEDLCLRRYALVHQVMERVSRERRAAMVDSFLAYLHSSAAFEVSPSKVFEFDPDNPPYTRIYTGHRVFPNHYYREVGQMNDEEALCAVLIDTHPKVKRWVRNPDPSLGGPGFTLQTSTDRFYPDFIAELWDERLLIVEYKGEGWRQGPDSEEKELIGKVWAEKSENRYVFLLVGKDDMHSSLACV